MKQRSVWCAAAVVLVVAGLGVAGSAQFVLLGSSFPTDSAPFYRITVEHSGLCLDIEGAQMMNGARAIQRGWLGGSSQLWELRPVGTQTYRIVNLHSGKCLSVGTTSQGNSDDVRQSVCHGWAGQLWRIEPAGGQDFRIVNVYTGKCLGIGGGSAAEGAYVDVLNCSDGPHQLWRIEAAAVETYEPQSGSYLVSPGALPSNAYLGITCQTTIGPGAIIASVVPFSPADMGDLRVGDIILSINGQPIISCMDIERLVEMHQPGDFLMVQIKRGGGSILLNVQLGWA
ncbi:MAG: RICIN domain-containing protein [Candidatus Bipolaricaulota bacterium]|nr:RICIN domain-containing protein [Candidatus Bipolaricaulota bacterium]